MQKKGISTQNFCKAIGIPERSFYFWLMARARGEKVRGRKTAPANKLLPNERKEIVKILLNKSWSDLTPRDLYYKLLDEDGRIVASPATFYRIAKKSNLLMKRVKTNSSNRFNREKPHIVARRINEVWAWDTTQICSDIRTERYYLYVIIDIWSRLVVGWCLEEEEKTEHAIELWKRALERQYISGNGLINHKDNGSIMTSREMIRFVRATNMIDSYSRAGVSDDNPFPEALFRTTKYSRKYPGYFCSVAGGRVYFEKYFDDYNFINRHSGIQFLAPAQRHYGEEEKILAKRNAIIDDFYKRNKHRYSGKKKLFLPITEVRIN